MQPSDPVIRKYEEELARKEKERKRRVWVRRRNSAYRIAKREGKSTMRDVGLLAVEDD